MRERPILFSGPMVRAILDKDRPKTLTRRPVKAMPPEPVAECSPRHKQKHPAPYFDAYCGQRKTEANPRGMSDEWCWWQVDDRQCLPTVRCPYGQPGDRLWVRETFALPYSPVRSGPVYYDADKHFFMNQKFNYNRLRPSIHMPRWACRLVLENTSTRVERLLDITEEDARAEGFESREAFLAAFRAIYKLPEDANPWVWVVEFKRMVPQPILRPKGSYPIETGGKVAS